MDCTICVAKNKGTDQLCGYSEAVTVFVIAYAKRWFSHDTAHLILRFGGYYSNNTLWVEMVMGRNGHGLK